MLKSGLNVWCYNLSASSTAVNYGALAEDLEIGTVAPGGCSTLKLTLKLRNTRLQRPELALFSSIAVSAPGLTQGGNSATPANDLVIWNGLITDPESGLTSGKGEYVTLTALGFGTTLRYDPRDDTYSGKTVKQIVADQMSTRNSGGKNFLLLDADTSQVFPDNPATTYSPVYTGNNMEEVVANTVQLAGDYTWGVWPHPQNVDAAGFPTAQLQVHQRDSSTVVYTVLEELGDIDDWHIVPSEERAYNVIAAKYNDPNHNPPVATATYTDSRLNADGSQGTAPFPRRKMLVNLTGVQNVTAAQAQSIANSYGAILQNPTYKIEVKLKKLRDANRNEIPLWAGMADRVYSIPTIGVRGTPIATAPTTGTNAWYCVQTTYKESHNDVSLTVELDNFVDTVALEIARLQLKSDTLTRMGPSTNTGMIQALGAPLKGFWGFSASNTVATQSEGPAIDFGATLSQAPTSISFAQSSAPVNVSSGPFANTFSVYGCNAWCVVSGGNAGWLGTFQTVGNCIRGLDHAAATLDWHCDHCDVVHTGIALRDRDTIMLGQDMRGGIGLAVKCPDCGLVEAFNPDLAPEDEREELPDGNYHAHRAEQARFIRALMAHPHIGLAAHVRPPRHTP